MKLTDASEILFRTLDSHARLAVARFPVGKTCPACGGPHTGPDALCHSCAQLDELTAVILEASNANAK